MNIYVTNEKAVSLTVQDILMGYWII